MGARQRKKDRPSNRARGQVVTISSGPSIFVVSDLHIGDSAKPIEFRPESGTWNIAGGFLGQFRELVRKYEIKPDFLVISGDITNKAAPAEVVHAAKAIQWISETLGLAEDKIIAVPGNHDLHWPICELDQSGKGFWSQFRFQQFKSQDTMLRNLLLPSGQDIFLPPYFLLREVQNTIFLSVNTAMFDYPIDKPHRGTVEPDTILGISDALSKIPDLQSKYKVCVLHHHPVSYSELDPLYKDFSKLTNAESLMELLLQRGFDMLIHGHKHVPFFTIQSRDGTRMLPVLGAGSFSANLIEPLYQGRVCNQVHLIEFAGRDGAAMNAFGRIKSWAHVTATGWVKSKHEHHGIFHLSGFGKYLRLPYVGDLLASLLTAEIAKKGSATLGELYTRNQELGYIPTKVLFDALNEVCKSRSLRIVGTIDDPSECTIISQ